MKWESEKESESVHKHCPLGPGIYASERFWSSCSAVSAVPKRRKQVREVQLDDVCRALNAFRGLGFVPSLAALNACARRDRITHKARDSV